MEDPIDDMTTRMDPEEAARRAVPEFIEEDWEEKWERDRGFLTDLDRRFLWNFHEYDTPQQTSARKRKIRNRIKDGLLDLSYLEHLTEKQRKKIFEELEEDEQIHRLRRSISDLVTFLYLGFDGNVGWLEEAVSHGIAKAEKKRHENETAYYAGQRHDAGVNVDIEVSEGYNLDELESQLRSPYPETLTPAEIGVLVREGVIANEDDLEAVHSGLFPEKTEGVEED